MATDYRMRLARITRVLVTALGIASGPPAMLVGQTAAGQSSVDTAAVIRAARATFQEAERAIADHHWSRRDTTAMCDDEDLGVALVFHRDSHGVVRRFEWSGGSEDHAVRNQYYYDAAGRQRFAFVTLSAVNGTQYEERVYFGDHGEVVRHLKRLVRGPGFPVEDETGIPDPLVWGRTVCK